MNEVNVNTEYKIVNKKLNHVVATLQKDSWQRMKVVTNPRFKRP